MADYEYGIMQRGIPGLHRGPWAKQFAEEWLQEWVDDCTPEQGQQVRELFYLVRRPVGEWERVDA